MHNFLVLTGDGINCERETALAIKEAGAEAEIVHINKLLENASMLGNYDAMIFPGGFSFGDDLGSGQVLALKVKQGLDDGLKKFVADQKPILGICNGFQALVKLGLLPDPSLGRCMALADNSTGFFLNKWVPVTVNSRANCVWTRYLSEAERSQIDYLPVRHGEGRVVFDNTRVDITGIINNNQIVLTYNEDINGSFQNIAGISDRSGTVFGLMPHPEAAISNLQRYDSSYLKNRTDPGCGLLFFQSCIRYLDEQA